MSGVICCVCNHKGGVGKSSFCINLGAALAIQKRRILVIDNDPQANSSGVLLQNNISIRNTLYELINPDSTEKPSIESCIYPSKHNGLFILPNVEESALMDISLAEKYPDSLLILRDQVREFSKRHFDYIFIDCMPTMGLSTANALYTADCAVVPIDANSSYSLEGLRKILTMVEGIQKSGNKDLRFLRLLINRVDRRTVLTQEIIEEITQRAGEEQIFKTTIPANVAFQKSEHARETIFRYEPTCRGAAAYRKLSREFISIFENDGVKNGT
jgi:chromosome partitioning protein